MDLPHKLCNTLFFKDLDQVKTCANSKSYKQGYGLRYLLFGFFISLFIGCILLNVLYMPNTKLDSTTGKNVPTTENDTYNKIILIVVFIGCIGLLYLSYIYGYNSADYETVKLAYDEDRNELDRKKPNFKSEELAIEDIVNDRRNIQNAYSQGYNNGTNLFDNRFYNTRLNHSTRVMGIPI